MLFSIYIFGGSSSATPRNALAVAVVLSGEQQEYQRVFSALENAIKEDSRQAIMLTSYFANNFISQKPFARPEINIDLIVTVGTSAARKVVAAGIMVPVVSIFLPKDNFNVIWHKPATTVAGIVMDQPMERFVELLRIVLENGDKVGMFSETIGEHAKIRDILMKARLSFVEEPINKTITARNIRRLLMSSDLVLVLPGQKNISPQRAKWLLYMAYREGKPVIAFSPSYVKAGALAAVYISPEAAGKQAAQVIIDISRSPKTISDAVSALDRIQFPQYFSIDVNSQVAMHLGINLPDERLLEKEIISNTGDGRSGSEYAD